MKFLKQTLLIVAITALFVGCVSKNRVAYNTLATIGYSTKAAYETYLDLVVKGQLSEAPVPAVTAKYKQFNIVYGAAVEVASGNLGVVAPPSVQTASEAVMVAIADAKEAQ